MSQNDSMPRVTLTFKPCKPDDVDRYATAHNVAPFETAEALLTAVAAVAPKFGSKLSDERPDMLLHTLTVSRESWDTAGVRLAYGPADAVPFTPVWAAPPAEGGDRANL